jgi:hypothetical protein
LKSTVVE